MFEAADTNGDGRLDREEFAEILADPLAPRCLESVAEDSPERSPGQDLVPAVGLLEGISGAMTRNAAYMFFLQQHKADLAQKVFF